MPRFLPTQPSDPASGVSHPLTAATKPGRSPSNRSLERGAAILKAFRPGSNLLGNMELAERTGLSKSTVSRLTQTLVGTGFLQIDPGSRAYRLAPSVLSLAHAMRTGSRLLSAVEPLMRPVAQAHRINVGLAAADGDEMVYLESIRYNLRPSLRSVVSGQRVPIELTSLGRAYMAAAPPERRQELLAHFQHTRKNLWPALGHELQEAFDQVTQRGYCIATWQAEVIAIATPLCFEGGVYALNMSVTSSEPPAQVVETLAPLLMRLKKDAVQALASFNP